MKNVIVSFAILMSLVACNNANNEVETPEIDIYGATVMGDLKTVEQHIAAGTDLNAPDSLGGSPPLVTAAVFGKTEVAQVLIDAGADLNTSNRDGSTALYCAAFFGRVEILKALLEAGADKEIGNNFGSTPLQSVSTDFEEVKMIYDMFSKELGPLGFRLDYNQLKKDRIEIAELLR